MRIACVSAFRTECAWLLGRLQNAGKLEVPGVKAWQGSLSGHQVQVVVCGVGPARAKEALENFRPYCRAERAYHLGVCGALDDGLPLYTVVVADSVCAAYRPDARPIELEVPDTASFSLEEVSLQRSRIVTHRLPVFSARVKDRLYRRFGAGCVDMESWEVAAFFGELQVPLTVVKAVSDRAGERSAAGFTPRARKASRLAGRTVCELIRAF